MESIPQKEHQSTYMKDILLLNLWTDICSNSGLRIAFDTQGWGRQTTGLTGTDVPNDEDGFFWRGGGDNESSGGIEDCDFDHWGVGRSSMHNRKSGHQGSMIACKIAAMVPDRVHSLALLNATGGDFQCFPEIFKEY